MDSYDSYDSHGFLWIAMDSYGFLARLPLVLTPMAPGTRMAPAIYSLACLRAYFLACLLACLRASLLACFLACLRACLLACSLAGVITRLMACLFAFLLAYLIDLFND